MSNLLVNNVVIHQLIKIGDTAKNYDKDYKLRSQENKVTDIINELILKLHDNYASKENSVQRGIFENDDTIGKGEFAKYFLAKEHSSSILESLISNCEKFHPKDHIPQDDNHFYNSSVYFMEELKKAGKSGSINGGLLFFADYHINNDHFFLVVMFEKEEGFNISDLDVEKVESIDIKKLKQALRVNHKLLTLALTAEKINDDKKNYVSFISTGNSEIRDFFINSAGCRKEFSNTKATEAVYNTVKNITDAYPNLKKHTWDIRRKITDYYEERITNHAGQINRMEILEHVAHSAAHFCSDADIYDGDVITSVSRETLLNDLLTTANSDQCDIPLNFKAVASVVERKKQYAKNYKSSYIRIALEDIGDSPDDLLYYDEEEERLYINDDELKEKIRQRKDTLDD